MNRPLKLAVVGHTNVGKTSLLRTLTRDAGFGEVSHRPSTTRHVEGARLSVGGEALLELNLIAGDESEYGLYVKQVNGITADYDVDQTYWAFYVNDAYATAGVDTTAVEAGAKYAFKVEK